LYLVSLIVLGFRSGGSEGVRNAPEDTAVIAQGVCA
jgi:hypothetical protein